MSLYTKPREHDVLIEWMIRLIKGTEPPDMKIEQAICQTIEGRGDFMYIEFIGNRKCQGAIIGIGKEPDVPFNNQALELSKYGAMHRDKLRLGATSIFVCQEKWEGDNLYLVLTGAKIYEKIIAPPKCESFKVRIERDGQHRIKQVHPEVNILTPIDQQGFINAYLELY